MQVEWGKEGKESWREVRRENKGERKRILEGNLKLKRLGKG